MKKFFYVKSGRDISIPATVSSALNTGAIAELKGNFIYYIEELSAYSLPGGSGAILAVFGNSSFNTLSDPISIDSVVENIYTGTSNSTWYLVSAEADCDTQYRNTLMWWGTSGSIVGHKFLRPFTGLKISLGTAQTKYEWNCTERTDNRWKRSIDYSSNGNNLQIEVTSIDVTPVTAYSLPISLDTVVSIYCTVTARMSDGTKRGMWRLSGLFYRNSGDVEVEGDIMVIDSRISDGCTWNATIVPDTISQSINIEVTGGTSETVLWTVQSNTYVR